MKQHRNVIVALSILIIFLIQPAFAKTIKTATAPKAAEKIQTKIEKKFTYCEVRDLPTGGKSGKIWVSQIFQFEYAPGSDGNGYINRLNDLAAEFYSQVVGMGGAGEKNCMPVAATLEELTTARSEQRVRDTKRVFMWATKWTDVNFTPKTWAPAIAGGVPANEDKFIFCYATDMSVARKSVSSDVITVTLPALSTGMPYYNRLSEYEAEFAKTVLPVSLPSMTTASCEVKDSYAEARHRLDSLRKLLGGRLTPWTVVTWAPTK